MKDKNLCIWINLFWSIEDECYIATVEGAPTRVRGIHGMGEEPKYALYELSIALQTVLEMEKGGLK